MLTINKLFGGAFVALLACGGVLGVAPPSRQAQQLGGLVFKCVGPRPEDGAAVNRYRRGSGGLGA